MVVEPNTRHEDARNKIVEGLQSVADLKPDELLAIAAQVVGQLIALQDQRKYSVPQVMGLVHRNIELGNKSALELVVMPGGHA